METRTAPDLSFMQEPKVEGADLSFMQEPKVESDSQLECLPPNLFPDELLKVRSQASHEKPRWSSK